MRYGAATALSKMNICGSSLASCARSWSPMPVRRSTSSPSRGWDIASSRATEADCAPGRPASFCIIVGLHTILEENLLQQAEIGIIGGSGLYSMAGLTDVREVALETPFGTPSDAYVLGTLAGRSV